MNAAQLTARTGVTFAHTCPACKLTVRCGTARCTVPQVRDCEHCATLTTTQWARAVRTANDF